MATNSNSLTEALTAIRSRLEKATPGPWSQNTNRKCNVNYEGDGMIARTECHGDAELIAHAPADIAGLISALELALYYVEGDSTYEALCERIAKILTGGPDEA